MLVNTEAIVLNTRKFGDTSKIVTLFTKEFGKCNVIAKGARQPKSKFGSSLEPMSYSDVTFYKKPNHDLHLLSKSELVKQFKNFGESSEHLSIGLMIIESIRQVTEENHVYRNLFEFIIHSFEIINKSEKNIFSVFTAFQIQIIDIIGFGINFINFDINNKNFVNFSFEKGTITDENIRTYRLKSEIYSLLYKIKNMNLELTSDIQILESQKKEIIDFIISYFSFHLEKHFSFKTFGLIG